MIRMLTLMVGVIYTCSLIGDTFEKNNIQVTYNICSKYHLTKYRFPYCITITNKSTNPIIIDPALIQAPLAHYKDIATQLRTAYRILATFFGGMTIGTAFLAGSFYKDKDKLPVYDSVLSPQNEYIYQVGPNLRRMFHLNLISTTLGSFLTGFLLYKLFQKPTLEQQLQKETFHKPIILQPGQTVTKLFWLQNPYDTVIINFNGIKPQNHS